MAATRVTGYCNAGSFLDNLTSAELYNPKKGTWSVTGSMHFERQYFTATLLHNGACSSPAGSRAATTISAPTTRQAELYNPATGTWTIDRLHA